MNNKNEKVVWVDIDDTLAMTWPVMVECGINFCERKGLNAQPNFNIESKDDLYFADILQIRDEIIPDFFEKYYPEYLARIEPVPGARKFLMDLKQHGYTIKLISARRDKDSQAYRITQSWLEENDLPYDTLIINCKDKAAFLQNEIGYFVDDSYHHCTTVTQKTPLSVIQKLCPFSKEAPGVFHGYVWDEILEHILNVEKE